MPLFAVAILLALTAQCKAQIIVRLNRDPVVGRREVRLDDIATITSASPQAAAIIGRLDVATIPSARTGTTLNTSFVRIRLMLAGWRQPELIVQGPEEGVKITYVESPPITDADIERAAQDAMLTMFDTTEDNIRVRLTNVFMSTLTPKLREQAGLRVEVFPPDRAALGPTSMRIRLWKGDNLLATRQARFNVMKRQRVVVTRVSLQRESTIDEADVQFENRFLSAVADEPTEADVYGQSVRSAIGPGKILSMRDLKAPVQKKNEIVVKARDNVSVTAFGNGWAVTLPQAEALESGRVGETIRIKNLNSEKIITGTIVDAGRVKIDMKRGR